MAKQTLAVLEQVPNDDDVKDQDDQHQVREAMDQFVHLNRDEEGRVSDRQPARPTYPEHQAHPFDQREETVKKSSHCDMQYPSLGELTNLHGEIREELAFRVDPQEVQQSAIFVRQIIVG